MLELKNGELLTAYGRFYTGNYDDHDPACVMGKMSKDRGRTWSESSLLRGNDVLTTYSCSLLRLMSDQCIVDQQRSR